MPFHHGSIIIVTNIPTEFVSNRVAKKGKRQTRPVVFGGILNGTSVSVSRMINTGIVLFR